MAIPWEIDTAVYKNKSFYVRPQEPLPTDIYFKPGGAKMYMVGRSAVKVFQYLLSTNWDIVSASYEDKYKDVKSEVANPHGVFFKPDGTKMYVLKAKVGRIYQYLVSTPWSVDTAIYENVYKDISEDGDLRGLYFKPDGSKMYIMGYASRRVYQYSLPSPWDVSTLSYDGKNKYVNYQDMWPYGVFFKPDGTKMYITGDRNNRAFQYVLATPWGVDTATYEKYKNIASEATFPKSLFFRPDGTKMYIVGEYYDRVFQYDLSFEFLQVTLSITENESILSIINNSILSIVENGSILSVVKSESMLSVLANESVLSVYENETILSIKE